MSCQASQPLGRGRVAGGVGTQGVHMGMHGVGGGMNVREDLGVWVLEETSGRPSLSKGKPFSFPAPAVVLTPVSCAGCPAVTQARAMARICNELLV